MTDGEKMAMFRNYLKSNLSKKRYKHSLNVADAALNLAMQYGANPNKAYFAGLVHDICKELPHQEQKRLMLTCPFPPDELELKTPSLYHAVAGSAFLNKCFDINDEEILRAVRFHTVAADNMSKVEAIVYMADLISAERDYSGVEAMRKLAFSDFDKAMAEALRFQISSQVNKLNYLIPSTARAYNEYIMKTKEKS